MIVILGSDGDSTRIVYNHLIQKFSNVHVVLEDPVSRFALLKARLKRLGFPRVLSQFLFMVTIRPVLNFAYRKRIAEIIQDKYLQVRPIPEADVIRLSSVNTPECLAELIRLDPKVVVVNGTRILGKNLLEGVPALFINTHTGITPAYRGVHGGYWALYEGNPAECGVTIHLVDPGVDTGAVIAQATIEPTKRDGFPSYPYLQVAAALPLLTKAVEDGIRGAISTRPSKGRSALWYHPGVVQYILGVFRGVM